MTRSDKGEIWIEGRSILINHDYSLIIQPRSIRIKRREMRIFLERLEAKRICQALTVTLLYLSRAPSALRNPFLSSPFLARLFLFSNFPRVLNTCILEMENISLLYLAQNAHFRNEEWNPFAYLYMIRVEFSARQAVEGAEVQTTREDSIRTAALPATKTCQC